MSTRYKGGNYSTLKLEDVTTSNIKGEITFFSHNYFLLVNYYVFFTLNNVLKKVSPKKTIRKTMNFGSTNWLNQKLYVFYLKWCIKKKKINPRKLYVKQWILAQQKLTNKKIFLETQRMAQHFYNTFITLLYFTLTCKKLTPQ